MVLVTVLLLLMEAICRECKRWRETVDGGEIHQTMPASFLFTTGNNCRDPVQSVGTQCNPTHRYSLKVSDGGQWARDGLIAEGNKRDIDP